jgi:glycosyltransferase involved in cell wall biosynthesis
VSEPTGPQHSPRETPADGVAVIRNTRKATSPLAGSPPLVPDVTVVIPTHNRRDLLSLSLRSVLWQRDVDLDVIVVDDGSTDGTAELVESIGDARIHLIRNLTAQGVSAARNLGISHSTGRWIAFLDDDDLWAPDKLALQLHAATSTGAEWVYVGSVNITLRHRVSGGAPPPPPQEVIAALPQSNVVPGGCSGVMVAKPVLDAVGRFDGELGPLADWDLWLRLMRVGPPAWVPQPLVAYRVHGGQLSLDAVRIQTEFRVVADRYGEGNRAILYRYLGWWALRVKRYRDALRFFVRGGLQRRPEYPPRVLAEDFTYLLRDIFEEKLRIRIPRSKRAPQLPEDQRKWRAQGQAWVNDFLARSGVEPVGREG